MSIPLDRLYHYIESVAREIHGNNVVIYLFFPHGSKNLENIVASSTVSSHDFMNAPHVYCYDQEPLAFDNYVNSTPISGTDHLISGEHLIKQNLRIRSLGNIYDRSLLLHSEQNGDNLKKYAEKDFITVYYWSHGLIARDWFRFAEHVCKTPVPTKTFLIYNRAWSGTREYRIKFADLLIEHNLSSVCQTYFNPIDNEVSYHDHMFKNKNFTPRNLIENHFTWSKASSCYSADFDINDYNNTQWEVVLETLFDDDRIQLTEKSLRPIACGHPFLLASTPGSLDYLKRYGFKTFNSVIDESYDTLVDPIERLTAIIDVMKYINSNLSNSKMEKIKDITNYNKAHFFSNAFTELIVDELKSNFKSALGELEKTNLGSVYRRNSSLLRASPIAREFINNTDPPVHEHLKSLLKIRNIYRKQNRKLPNK